MLPRLLTGGIECAVIPLGSSSNLRITTYTQKSQPLVPVDTPLLIIIKHIPRQSDIDKTVKSIETHMIHGLELPIQVQDLIKAYQTLAHF